MSAWIAEPETAMETRIELFAVEAELRKVKAECCNKQAEILELEADRRHLQELLAVQTSGTTRALATAAAGR